MAILAASIEVETDDVKWQPDEHGINLDKGVLAESRWIVTDERGQVIDRSPALSRADPRDAAIFDYAREWHASGPASVPVGDWRVLQRQLGAPQPKPLAERDPHEFAALRITVARSPEALETTVRTLAIAVIALPAMVWAVAAAVGRRYVERAIRPVRAMAEAARGAGAMAALIVASVVVGSSLAVAQSERPVGKTLLEIVGTLEGQGYGPITEVSRERGTWEVEAYKNGTPYELRVDPATGGIISEHRDDGDPTPPANARKLSEIVRGLEAAGYTHIDEISFERRTWEVEAVRGGTKRELRVDPITGQVVSDRIDD
ncbi:MAG: PepSY domain-containing protein [Candidatus Rokubacteria bacterium]|nr:PepSY domain-containing protein [Candidatus Rokubacteria bacterium]